jgi:hypothetical protein
MRMVGILKTAVQLADERGCVTAALLVGREEGGWDNDWIKRYCWIE